MAEDEKSGDPADVDGSTPRPKDDLWDSEFWKDEQALRSSSQTPARFRRSFFDVLVTTGDIKVDYRIIGPVYFQINNKAFFQSEFRQYEEKHKGWLRSHYSDEETRKARGWSGLFGEIAIGASQFETAFFIAVQELKLRAHKLGGNAIVAMRQDVDIDNVGVQGFYLQMYGTAVKLADDRDDASS